MVAATIPETAENKLGLLREWLRAKCSPFEAAYAKAEYEIMTGKKLPEKVAAE